MSPELTSWIVNLETLVERLQNPRSSVAALTQSHQRVATAAAAWKAAHGEGAVDAVEQQGLERARALNATANELARRHAQELRARLDEIRQARERAQSQAPGSASAGQICNLSG